MQNFDSDQRQIPIGLGWPIMFRSLEDGGDFGLLCSNHASDNNRLKRPIIAVNTRWEPECDPKAVRWCAALLLLQTSLLKCSSAGPARVWR
jgi:hypothetical protein